MRARKQFFDNIINIFKPKLQTSNQRDKNKSNTMMVEQSPGQTFTATTTTTTTTVTRSGRISKSTTDNNNMPPPPPSVKRMQHSVNGKSEETSMSRTTSYNMHDHDSIPSQYLLLFLGETLASLPYKFEEEPLYLIYLIDRVLTIHGTNTIDHANTLLKSRRANERPKRI